MIWCALGIVRPLEFAGLVEICNETERSAISLPNPVLDGIS